MALIEWTRDLEFGIPVIDGQHKQIVDFINELDDANRTGNKEETAHVMEGLLNYTITHFEFEEELQEKAGYQFLKAHRRIHQMFMQKIAAIRERGNQGEDITSDLLALLKLWLASHIKSEDRDYVETVRTVLDSKDAEHTNWLQNALGRFRR
jgi:hemerythrin